MSFHITTKTPVNLDWDLLSVLSSSTTKEMVLLWARIASIGMIVAECFDLNRCSVKFLLFLVSGQSENGQKILAKIDFSF